MIIPKGLHIVLEGCDGVGKQTQTEMLVKAFEAAGREVCLYSFHRYATPLGQLIKAHLKRVLVVCDTADIHTGGSIQPANDMIFQCMASADKYAAADEIRQALAAGKVVICDRWWQSSYAYGAADGLDRDWLRSLGTSLPQANHNILLRVPHDIVRERKPIPDDRYEADHEKQKQVDVEYMFLWGAEMTGKGSWHIVNAQTKTREAVHALIWNTITRGAL